MKEVTTILILLLAISYSTTYSQEKLEVDGAMIIKNSEDVTPVPGTIRFNLTTSDLEGWNGTFWASLTGNQYELGEMMDQDGNTYPTVIIGTQEWMAANLRTMTYRNSNPITLISNDAAGEMAWSNANYGAYCVYDTVGTGYPSFDVNEFGHLYNGYAVNEGDLCPTGWHVPSDTEWTTLSDYLGGTFEAGGPMKEFGIAHWKSPNTAASNSSGFTGLPGSYRDNLGSFSEIGPFGGWWSSTEVSMNIAWYRFLFHNDDSVFRDNLDKKYGFSVRCLKD